MIRDQVWALVHRPDLLATEAKIVSDRNITWVGRLRDLDSYGRSGGSAMDRRMIVEFMAEIEKSGFVPTERTEDA